MREPLRDELTAPEDAPLIAIPFEEDGRVVIHYFTSEAAADAATEQPEGGHRARALAGAWSDLDWDEALEELDRIDRESTPTPIIDRL